MPRSGSTRVKKTAREIKASAGIPFAAAKDAALETPPPKTATSAADAHQVAIASGAGGMGCSTLTAHLAACYAADGMDVLVIDTDTDQYGVTSILVDDDGTGSILKPHAWGQGSITVRQSLPGGGIDPFPRGLDGRILAGNRRASAVAELGIDVTPVPEAEIGRERYGLVIVDASRIRLNPAAGREAEASAAVVYPVPVFANDMLVWTGDPDASDRDWYDGPFITIPPNSIANGISSKLPRVTAPGLPPHAVVLCQREEFPLDLADPSAVISALEGLPGFPPVIGSSFVEHEESWGQVPSHPGQSWRMHVEEDLGPVAVRYGWIAQNLLRLLPGPSPRIEV